MQSNWKQHAVAVLLHWLGKPTGESGDQQAKKIAHHAGATAFRMVPNPLNPELEDTRRKLNQFWSGLDDLACERPAQSVACGNVNSSSLMLRYAWPSELANSAGPIPLSPGFVIYNDVYLQNEPERHLVWRRWLWLFNIFQSLPGVLLATQAGLDAGDYSTLKVSAGIRPASGSQGAAHAAVWETVIGQAMSTLAVGLRTLMDAGFAPPDEVGYELEQAGEVVAEAELAWRQSKLVLLVPEHAQSVAIWETNGWRALIAENEWPQRLANELSNNPPPKNDRKEDQE